MKSTKKGQCKSMGNESRPVYNGAADQVGRKGRREWLNALFTILWFVGLGLMRCEAIDDDGDALFRNIICEKVKY